LPVNFCDTAVKAQVYCACLNKVFFNSVGDIDSSTSTPRKEVVMDGVDACGMVSSFLHIGSFPSRPSGVYQPPEKGQ
jgi:hypothetical protein